MVVDAHDIDLRVFFACISVDGNDAFHAKTIADELGGGADREDIGVGQQFRSNELWLADHPKLARGNCRFDVVAYDGPPDNARFSWLQGAFEA